MNFILSHKILAGVIAVLLVIAIWIGVTSSSSSSSSLLTSEVIAEDGPDKDLVSTLLALRTVKLDASLFTDPTFLTLKDFSVAIIEEPTGRPNPFAPLSGTNAAAANNAATPATPQTTPAPAKKTK